MRTRGLLRKTRPIPPQLKLLQGAVLWNAPNLSRAKRVRAYLWDHPSARNQDIVAALQQHGITYSDAASVKHQLRQEGVKIPRQETPLGLVRPKRILDTKHQLVHGRTLAEISQARRGKDRGEYERQLVALAGGLTKSEKEFAALSRFVRRHQLRFGPRALRRLLLDNRENLVSETAEKMTRIVGHHMANETILRLYSKLGIAAPRSLTQEAHRHQAQTSVLAELQALKDAGHPMNFGALEGNLIPLRSRAIRAFGRYAAAIEALGVRYADVRKRQKRQRK